MVDLLAAQKLNDLTQDGYLASVAAWVQVSGSVTTRLNAFNTLGEQHMVIGLLDQAGNLVGDWWEETLPNGRALRLDLADLLPAGVKNFEGAAWLLCKGTGAPSNLGLQAMDLDFIDTTRPEGHVMGTVHVIQDFFNTLGLPPWLDMVCPRVMVELDEDEASRWTSFLGMAHFPTQGLEPAVLQVRLANEAGEWIEAEDTITIDFMGSAFVSLESLFPKMHDHLLAPGKKRGFGAVNVREITPNGRVGLCAMLKVVNNETGDFMVNHLNDRHFAKPTQNG